MRKLLFITLTVLGCVFLSGARNTYTVESAPKGDLEIKDVMPLPAANSIESNVNPKRMAKSSSKKIKDATAADFIGQWEWIGKNLLSAQALPNKGIMTIEESSSDPTHLIIRIPVEDIELQGYVKDSKLYIPNQKVDPCESIQNRTDVWFINYTVRDNIDDPEDGSRMLIKAENEEFHFQINDNGILSAGITLAEIDREWFNMSNEEREQKICIPTIGIEGEGYYWFCYGLESITDNDLVELDGITYYINNYSGYAEVIEADFDIDDAVIEERIEKEGRFFGVEKMAENIFKNHENLRSITMPNTLWDIPRGAFQGCINLTRIKIPENVRSIGIAAFEGCTALQECIMGNSIYYIREYAFYECNNLKQIVLPNSLIELGTSTFAWCSGLESVTIGDDLTGIPNFCFASCSNLKEIKFGEKVETIGYGAFFSCEQLENIVFPNSLTNIDGWAFGYCYSLKTITLPSSLESFAPSMFAYCESLNSFNVAQGNKNFSARNGTVYSEDGASLLLFPAGRGGIFNVPEGTSEIGYCAFHSCSKVREINIPESVTELGAGAFVNCLNLRALNIPEGIINIPSGLLLHASSLTELRIPSSVEGIEDEAFADCTSLTNVEFGEGLTFIGENIFEGCDALSSLYCLATTPPVVAEGVFSVDAFNGVKLYVPQNSLTSYLDASPWNGFVSINRIGGTLTLSDKEVTLTEKEVYQLGVYGSPNKVIWASSNSQVAYANECGLIVARIPGMATITANSDGLSASCNITVVSRGEVKGKRRVDEEIKEPTDIIIESIGGNPLMVNLRLIPIGSRTVIDWSTSDSSIATVEDGLVKIYGEGGIDFSVETANGLEDSFDTETDEFEISDVFTMGMESESNDIYSLQGIWIKKGANAKDIESLPSGIYIIGGKKVVKK